MLWCLLCWCMCIIWDFCWFFLFKYLGCVFGMDVGWRFGMDVGWINGCWVDCWGIV